MKILGIETSCDETGVCIIDASGDILSGFRFTVLGNALYSQAAIHAPYGGVFPNLAKREHAKNLIPLLSHALHHAHQGRTYEKIEDDSIGPSLEKISEIQEILKREPGLSEELVGFLTSHEKPDIDAIAVTRGPGLEPALWVGVNFARALSTAWQIPLVGVDHMEGHIVLSMMNGDGFADFEFPTLSLLISGGHTELVLSRSWLQYELLGSTRDDAVGEAFDKVARLLGLPYPGGPEISRLAKQAREQGPALLAFTPPMLRSDDYDFSFSGLKTEVRKYTEEHSPLSEEMKKQIACAFENAVAEVLVAKTMRAAEEFAARSILVGGGVSANMYVREQLNKAIRRGSISTQMLVPPPELATDNALMIALAGYFHALQNDFADPATLTADGNVRLA